MDLISVLILGAYAVFTAIFGSIFVHEYIHILQMRPQKPTEIVLLGWKPGGWGGWVNGKGDPNDTPKFEAQGHLIDGIVMLLILIPYVIIVALQLIRS